MSYSSIAEIINKLKLIWRRRRRISESDMLWTNVCLDEYGTTHFSHKIVQQTFLNQGLENDGCTISFTWNRPFPSSPGPLYQNEVKRSAFDIEMTLHSHSNKTHFHKKGCALGLILKVRVFGTRKWPIVQFDGIGKLDALFLVDSTEHFLFSF